MLKFLEELINIIRERKNTSSDNSYTNKLLNSREMCFEKVNEEINELLEAIKKILIKFMKQQMFYIT